MSMPDQVFYLLVCRECFDLDDDPLVIPFESAEARGKWAAAHTRGTGHDRWYVEDDERDSGAGHADA
jgi:hypothetical protein